MNFKHRQSNKEQNCCRQVLIRNKKCEHRLNLFKLFANGTSNMAETRAILEGIMACRELSIMDFQIRIDSRLLLGWIKKDFKITWNLRQWWKEIFNLISHINYLVAHSFREGNQAAGLLSKWSLKCKGDGTGNISLDRLKGILQGIQPRYTSDQTRHTYSYITMMTILKKISTHVPKVVACHN